MAGLRVKMVGVVVIQAAVEIVSDEHTQTTEVFIDKGRVGVAPFLTIISDGNNMVDPKEVDQLTRIAAHRILAGALEGFDVGVEHEGQNVMNREELMALIRGEANPTPECIVSPFSSRICNRGVKGCDVMHLVRT